MHMRLFLTLLFTTLATLNQAQVLTEDFGTASSCSDIDTLNTSLVNITSGTWRTLYDSNASASPTNIWFVSSREAFTGEGNCGDGCSNNATLDNNTLHISTIVGTVDPNATYNPDSATRTFIYSPTMNFQNYGSDYKVSFDYLLGGDAGDSAALVLKVGQVSLNPFYTIGLPKTNTGSCSTAGEWVHFEYYFPCSFNSQQQARIGFMWYNDGSGGTQPSFAVDNIVVDVTDPYPIILASETAICDGSSITFTDSTLGCPIGYNWQFGSSASPTTSTNPSETVTFTTPGTYTITLTTTNSNGSNDTTMTVNVLNCFPPTPNVWADDTTVCRGQYVNFTDTSLAGTFGKGDWIWQFQGGFPNVSTDQNPDSILYTTTGVYDVTLTVTDTATGEDSTIVFDDFITVGTCSVTVAAPDMDTNVVCNNGCIEFYDLSTGEPDSLIWEFAGGSPALISDSAHKLDTVTVCYTTPGIYSVTLTSINGAGSDDSVLVDWIEVKDCPTPEPMITVSSRIICPGAAIVFEDQSLYGEAWFWEFPGGEPSTSTDRNPVNIQYNTPGIYPVILTVSNVNDDSTVIFESYITVDSCLPPDMSFEVERDSICRGSCVQFFNTSKRADTIFWIFFRHPDTALLGDTMWIVDNGGNVKDTLALHEDYYPLYTIKAGIKDTFIIDTLWGLEDPILCFDDSLVIGVQLFGENVHDVGIDNKQDIAVLNVGGAYPELDPGPDKYVRIDNIESRFYLEDTVTFEAEGTAPYYDWFPEDGLSCYDCARPIIYPTETRKYFITNYDDYGCQAYDSVIVYVEEAYYAGIPNIFSPNGDDNNDILWVRGNAISSDGFVFRVWNRFGELVFESYSQNTGWDGTYKGVPAPIGSYKYYAKVIFTNGVVEEMSGNVTLVRY